MHKDSLTHQDQAHHDQAHHDRAHHDRLVVDDPVHTRMAAGLLASGKVIAHGFGNFYAITARGDAASVRGVNLMKGRPPEQVGSVTAPPERIASHFDWSALPDGLTRHRVEAVFDAFFRLGPFGFRGPASPTVGRHLSSADGDITTTQVIAPGYACPSNRFLSLAAEQAGTDLLYITSANRSRHLTGADDSPAHWRANGVREDFGPTSELLVLEHPDEPAARERYPRHLPMSTTILGFHRVEQVGGRPNLVLERHGSLHVDEVRATLDHLGFGVTLGPHAHTRLGLRAYPHAVS
jgi:hypothetical protein